MAELDSLFSAASILSFAALAVIVWNVSRKYTKHQIEYEALKEKLESDVQTLKEKEAEDIQSIHLKIEQNRTERKEDIAKWGLSNKDDFNTIRQQLDSQKSDIKQLSSSIVAVDTRVKNQEEVIKELNMQDKEDMKFSADWNQRIEDRVEQVRDLVTDMMYKLGFKPSADRNNSSK